MARTNSKYIFALGIALLCSSLGAMQKESQNTWVFSENNIDATFVFMWSGRSIEQIISTDTSPTQKSIFSQRFIFCTGVGCYVLCKSGYQAAFLTHFPPANPNDKQIETIKSLGNLLKNKIGQRKDTILCATGIIFHPVGTSDEAPADPLLVEQLQKTLQSLQLNNLVMKTDLYSNPMWLPCRQDHPGICKCKEFEIVLDADPKKSYWQSVVRQHIPQPLV